MYVFVEADGELQDKELGAREMILKGRVEHMALFFGVIWGMILKNFSKFILIL